MSCATMSKYGAKFKFQGQNSHQIKFRITKTSRFVREKLANPANLTPPIGVSQKIKIPPLREFEGWAFL